MSYQALPAGSGLISRARRDAALGEILFFVPQWCRDGFERGPRPWPEADRLCDELRELAARHPGLEKRNYFLDRQWDVLHYLLSANRRQEPATEQDVALEHAVVGAMGIADHVCGGQGVPVKYVQSGEVSSIASLLEPMSAADLGLHYDPQKMSAAGVYKFWPDRAEDVWSDVVRRFNDFRAFYLEAARHAEGVLVCLD